MFDETEIPEAVFGKFVKDSEFRGRLLDDDADLSQVLDREGIYISETGLLELKELLDGLEEGDAHDILVLLDDPTVNFPG